MPNYNNGKIYRIISYNSGRQYIGSTCQKLSSRLSGHRRSYNTYIKGNTKTYCTSYKIIEDGNYKIELIINYSCNSKEELTAKEGEYIRQLKCVNNIIPGRTRKQHYEDNKEKLLKKSKNYYEKNKEEIKKKHKIYRENNKERLLENRKISYQKNKKQNNKKLTCECGSIIIGRTYNRHCNSKKHINYLNGDWIFKISV